MKKPFFVSLTLALAILAASPAHAALGVFACEPEWGALASVLGGPDVSVFNATTARQDPHQIQARPALIARLRNADLVVCTGAELEIGWMPVLLRQSANGRVQPGTPGYFEAAQQVRLMEVPAILDRSLGDIHPGGNPHIQTGPQNIRAVALALTTRLSQIDPAHAAGYAQRSAAFVQQWDAAVARWQAQAAPLKGVHFVSYHKEWVYLATWLGMEETATIEPKPGVPPGSAYLAQLLDEMPRHQTRLIVYAAYQDARAPQFVSEKSGVPIVLLPFTVGGTDKAADLFGLFDDTIARLLAGLEKSPAQ
jgi:zinc/manganese transport system substrate-binding protein